VRTLRCPIALLLILFAATACTKDSGSQPVSPTGRSSSAPSPVTSTPVAFTPGAFRYVNAGLVVTLTLKTNVGTMTVDNGTDHDLAKPDLYVLDGLSVKRIDGRVLNSQPIPQGGKQIFKVQFPPEVNDKEIGLVMLLFGPDNYGAFAPA
jgi:hypothetical protein